MLSASSLDFLDSKASLINLNRPRESSDQVISALELLIPPRSESLEANQTTDDRTCPLEPLECSEFGLALL